MPDTPEQTVTMISPEGEAYDVAAGDVAARQRAGFTVESNADRAARVGKETREGDISGVESFGQGFGRGLTLGGTDALQAALGGDAARQYMREAQEAHSTLSTVGEITGAVAPALFSDGGSLLARSPVAALSRIGSAIGESEAGASIASQLARRGIGGAVEGAGIGLGQGVSELAQSDDPITLEHAASVLSSNMLYGGALGGGAGVAGLALEKGLTKASEAMRAAADRGIGADSAAVSGDLVGLDSKGLKAAKATELDRIEAERVPMRKQVADDIGSFRSDLKEQKLWLVTKDAEDKGLRTIGKQTLKADRRLDTLLDNPISLAERPQKALDALQQQEHALTQLAGKSDELRASFAADTTGERAATLDKIPAAIERNRQLQARIKDLVSEPKSARLAAIENAQDVLSRPAPSEPFVAKMGKGLMMGKVAAALSMTPLAPVAHVVGALAADKIGSVLFGKLGPAMAEASAKSAGAIDAFVNGVKKADAALPVVATEVLHRVRYAPAAANDNEDSGKRATLAELYKKRSAEVRSQTAYNAMGQPEMRPEARAQVAQRLAPIRAASPVMADRLESHAAARIEFLSSLLPRRPDLPQAPGAPDLWQPSDLAMRSWARSAAAAEDPAGVEHRLASGSITPEDSLAYRTLYPERYAQIMAAITGELANGKKTIPYSKRVALSIFSGTPVDPAMSPPVLRVLQSQFNEPGTNGGTQQPTPSPQFGSVKSIDGPTAGQSRETGQDTASD